jgi:hypothetical protein
MQTAGSVTAVGNCVAQFAGSVTTIPGCAMQPGTAVTQTASVVTHEPSLACHEADSRVVAVARHHPPEVAAPGLGFLESAGPLPVPLLWTTIMPSVFCSWTARYSEPQSASQLTGGAGKPATTAGAPLAN